MKIIHQAAELRPGRQPVCAAVGVFDGVHRGHQRVIQSMLEDAHRNSAQAVVVTFDGHPAAVLDPPRAPLMIHSLSQKLHTLAQLKPDAILLYHFDRPFSQQRAEIFIQRLAREFGRMISISVGENFYFGHGRRGNLALLKQLGQEWRFTVRGCSPVTQDGQVVSSTRVRDAIRSGQLDLAGRMLGRPYSLRGIILKGDQLGRRLGFPTANIDAQGLVVPPNGVYAAWAAVADKPPHAAVVNIGFRPTLNLSISPLRVEAHLLEFNGDLYGQEMEITPMARLRDERQFPSLEALRESILGDVEAARHALKA